MRWVVAAVAAFIGWGGEAAAVEFLQKGVVLAIGGPIRNGDQYLLRDYLARPEAGQIKLVYLSSTGGFIFPANEMARTIREKGYATVVDAARGQCSSACTGLFVAGTRRYYLNAGFADGDAKQRGGLGFHAGSSVGQAGRDYSGPGTAAMINMYYEMGVPGAASLMTGSEFRGVHRLSGKTALALGIATNLSLP
ncbi:MULTISPECIES: hypothetical protein [Bosea]|jgi:hypothetical protein|uniref:Uncharacterized protein n=1 Tax=Bosea vaviloviae TaxID=1526658 RepID=A0A0N1F5W4_9HYPH|nr:hypothetical protein [Bosea vaviloviae]KPH80428.1 hypothetical protein AE618_13470 [Bosea vaviloviae]